jgi:7-carboxy-7-deazaguanine synthase
MIIISNLFVILLKCLKHGNEIEAFRVEMDIPKRKTWLMPPGDTRDELIRVYPMVMDFCRDNGYNFTGREHIIAFDTKREV